MCIGLLAHTLPTPSDLYLQHTHTHMPDSWLFNGPCSRRETWSFLRIALTLTAGSAMGSERRVLRFRGTRPPRSGSRQLGEMLNTGGYLLAKLGAWCLLVFPHSSWVKPLWGTSHSVTWSCESLRLCVRKHDWNDSSSQLRVFICYLQIDPRLIIMIKVFYVKNNPRAKRGKPHSSSQ